MHESRLIDLLLYQSRIRVQLIIVFIHKCIIARNEHLVFLSHI